MRSVMVVALAVSSGVCAQSPRIQDRVDEIVVTGEQPGPKLWKLTKGGHVLWILATVNPKPRDIIWKSAEVERVLDDTQEVFNQTNAIDFDVKSLNPFARMRAYGAALRLSKESQKQLPLREAVSAEDDARFEKLKALYLPDAKELDLMPPLAAVERLYNAALDAKGLTMRAQIHDKVHWLARKRVIKISDVKTEIELDVDDFVQVQLEFLNSPKESELACFRETLDQIETGLSHLTARANAWAKGDMERLKVLDAARRRPSCGTSYESIPRIAAINAEADKHWLDVMEASVKKNRSTLAMLEFAELIEPNGLLSQLATRGFEIEEPM